MILYIVKRIMLGAFTLTVISFFSFILIQLPPGDYVDYYITQSLEIVDYEVTPEEEAELREEYGLNQPILAQYGSWIYRMVIEGEFGYSFYGVRKPNRERIANLVPTTIALATFTIFLTWTIAIPIGIYSAVRQNTIADYSFTLLGFTGLAVPDFLLALVLMYLAFDIFGASVGGLYSGNYETAPWSLAKIIDLIKHIFIPAAVLGTSGTAGLIRIMRNNLLDELRKPYVVAAYSKGLEKWKTVLKYPVRVAINPFVSSIGAMLPALISGSVIVSVVMSLPTVGPLLLHALGREDIYLAGTIILLLATLTVVGTLISDLLLVLIDPRIKITGSVK